MTVSVKDIVLKTLPDGGIIAPSETPVSQEKPKAKAKTARKAAPSGPAPPATAASKLKPAKGFQVELVHAVPRDQEGSWVSMTLDPKDRLIVSDQYGKLFRVTPSPLGGKPEETKVEPIDVDDRRGPGAALGVRQPLRRREPGQKYPQRPLPRPRHRTATTSSTRSSCSARSTAAASTARTPSC